MKGSSPARTLAGGIGTGARASRQRLSGAIEGLLEQADVQVDGARPWDPQVRDPRLFRRVVADGTLGLGEAYMDGWWDCAHLDEFFHRVLRAGVPERLGRNLRLIGERMLARLVNPQRPARAFEIGRRHYDLGDDLFEAMLDRRMIYTCAWWGEGVRNLDEAQEAKLEMACRKLDLRPGMRLLDIGCGWGGMLQYAAQRHGVSGLGVSVSQRQIELGRSRLEGLPVELRLCDYRQLEGRFDRIVSLGMIEHVGWRNYRTLMKIVRRCLAPEGLFLLQTIGSNISTRTFDPWMRTYIFPNTQLPSAAQLSEASEGLLVMEDWHNFGPHYDRTLLAWHERFEAAWERLRGRYDERFRRMWRYYLLSCAGCFRSRRQQLWQVLFSRDGRPGGCARIG